MTARAAQTRRAAQPQIPASRPEGDPMGVSDVVTAAVILGAAAYLLYRSVWKKKGHCPGCDSGGCASPRPTKARSIAPAHRE